MVIRLATFWKPSTRVFSSIASTDRLQDKFETFSFAEAEKIVGEELGVRLSKAFQNFDDQPMTAAALGQSIAPP